LNDQNLVVKKLVIRGIKFIVEKFRELENENKIKDQIEKSGKKDVSENVVIDVNNKKVNKLINRDSDSKVINKNKNIDLNNSEDNCESDNEEDIKTISDKDLEEKSDEEY